MVHRRRRAQADPYHAPSPPPGFQRLNFITKQFHDGLGFLTNHAIITNTFEYSLQRVNPKLSLPYWDFTIDGSSAGGTFGEAVDSAEQFSPIFSSDWFGWYDEKDNMVSFGFPRECRKRENGRG